MKTKQEIRWERRKKRHRENRKLGKKGLVDKLRKKNAEVIKLKKEVKEKIPPLLDLKYLKANLRGNLNTRLLF